MLRKGRSLVLWRIVLATFALVVAVGLAACGDDDSDSDDGGGGGNGAAGELTTVRFAQPTPESVGFYPSFVADILGYFEDEGVRIELAPVSEDISMAALVTNGTADISAAGDSEALFATAEGADVRVTYDFNTLAVEGIVTPADSEVESVADLAGKTIGLASDEDRALVASALGTADMTLDDLEAAPVIGTAGGTIASSFEGGRIDAYAGAAPEFETLLARGFETRNITPEELAKRPAGSFVVTAEMIERDSDVLEGFMRAYAKATWAGLANPEALEAMARQRVPDEWRDEKVGRAALELTLEAVTPENPDLIGEVRRDVWDVSQEQLIAAGELDEPVDLDTLLDDQFIEAVNDWDRSEVEQDMEAWFKKNG